MGLCMLQRAENSDASLIPVWPRRPGGSLRVINGSECQATVVATARWMHSPARSKGSQASKNTIVFPHTS